MFTVIDSVTGKRLTGSYVDVETSYHAAKSINEMYQGKLTVEVVRVEDIKSCHLTLVKG